MLLPRLLFVLLLLAFSQSTFAQNASRSITVVGTAESSLPPDAYFIRVKVMGEGKTMALARDEFGKKQENLRTVFNEMDFPQLVIESRGRTISDHSADPEQIHMMMIEGDNGADKEKEFFVAESLEFKWQASPQTPQSDLETGLANLLDRIVTEKLSFDLKQQAQYYGAWESNLVVGRSSKLQAEERKLRAAALEDAKAQALELAALANSKLGRVLEIEVAPETTIGSYLDHSGIELDDPTSCKLGQQIQLKAVVKVKFELE